jgi:hypothetical protein
MARTKQTKRKTPRDYKPEYQRPETHSDSESEDGTFPAPTSPSTITKHAAAKYKTELGGEVKMHEPEARRYKRPPYPRTMVDGHWDNLPTGDPDEQMIHCDDCNRTTYVYLKSIDRLRELCAQCQDDDYNDMVAAEHKETMAEYRRERRAATNAERKARREKGQKDVSDDSVSSDEELA